MIWMTYLLRKTVLMLTRNVIISILKYEQTLLLHFIFLAFSQTYIQLNFTNSVVFSPHISEEKALENTLLLYTIL